MPGSKKAKLKRKSVATKKNRTATARKPQASSNSTSAGKSRAEGIRLFALAGRPGKEDFVKVYGPPQWTEDDLGTAGQSGRDCREVSERVGSGHAAGEVKACRSCHFSSERT